MGERSVAVDKYISNAQPFARPIVTKLRALFHQACPEVEEGIKWNCPFFAYKGILGGVAAFKKHATWGLWKAALIDDPSDAIASKVSSAMGAGKFTDVSQLPPDKVIIRLIKQAVKLNEQGVKTPQRTREAPKPPPKVPADLAAALKKNPKALEVFKHFSNSHKREYVEWITEAKQQVTREKRLAQAIVWMSQGKPRNWKYMNC